MVTSPECFRIFHANLYGRFIEIKSTPGERTFEEQMKTPIFLEGTLAIVTM